MQFHFLKDYKVLFSYYHFFHLQGSGIFHDVVIHCCVVLSQKTKRTHSFTHVCKISR